MVQQQVKNNFDENNPNEILKVPRDCCFELIKQAYINLAKQHHPDSSQSKEDV